jgi:hypothetical protein
MTAVLLVVTLGVVGVALTVDAAVLLGWMRRQYHRRYR